MPLSPQLLAVLRCTESKERLVYFPDGLGRESQGQSTPFLFCPTSRLRYPIDENGFPVMLMEASERLDEDTCQSLLDRARELGLAVPEGSPDGR